MSADTLAEPLALGLEKSLRDLEWGRIVDAVAERCAGPLGDRLEALPFASDVEGARLAMAETAEALGLRREGDPLPLSGIRDVRSSLDRVARSGALDGPSLRDVRLTLTAGRALRTFLARRKERCARLYAACPLDPTLDGLERELAAAIEPDGTVSDAASPELRRLRAEVGHLRARIIGRLEQILIEHRDVVQDRFHTVREGRYVVPMRTDAHDRIPGIVHGTSGSGATVFIEPRALVEQQNRLTLALGELEAEQARILAQLSELVGERLHELRAAVEALDHADLRSASARLEEGAETALYEDRDEQSTEGWQQQAFLQHREAESRRELERLTQLLVAGARVAPLAQRVLHARLKEVVGEEVERAEEHDARVVARLQRGDEQRGRADRVRVVGDRAVRVVGVGGGRSRQHFDL
jgi:DNA mismatch repair protein MutS2